MSAALKRDLRDDRGFTIIELLVVIVIIAVLTGFILAALSSAQKGSRDAKRRSDLNQYKTALANYHSSAANYPIQAVATAITASNSPYASLSGQYFSSFVNDPTTGASYFYIGSGTSFGMCGNLERSAGNRFEVGPTVSREVAGAADACDFVQ